MTRARRVVLSWSSGKDSAWCLHTLNLDPDYQVVGLLTTFNQVADRVAMHAVRRQLVNAQAAAVGLPLEQVELPWPCSNNKYELAMERGIQRLRMRVSFDAVAFGDLFLADIRRYREEQMQALGVATVFPLWESDTTSLAQQMIGSGVRAVLTCVDPCQCPADLAGEAFDDALLARLPESVDPCGENGEFHTFVSGGPMFRSSIAVRVGEKVERDGFVFADVLPA